MIIKFALMNLIKSLFYDKNILNYKIESIFYNIEHTGLRFDLHQTVHTGLPILIKTTGNFLDEHLFHLSLKFNDFSLLNSKIEIEKQFVFQLEIYSDLVNDKWKEIQISTEVKNIFIIGDDCMNTYCFGQNDGKNHYFIFTLIFILKDLSYFRFDDLGLTIGKNFDSNEVYKICENYKLKILNDD